MFRLCHIILLCTVFQTSKGFSVSPIDTALAIRIGGIDQWITIKGAERTKPVLLFLHGGPGNSVISYSDKFTGELQKKFVVVQWDQRASGKTASLNKSDQQVSVALMESDALGVIYYLRNRFHHEQVFLMGHSWGGFLALLIAAHHPELLSACIAISPMIRQQQSEQLALDWMMDQARKANNTQALAELQTVRIPFSDGEQLYFHRGWLLHFIGGKRPQKHFVLEWSTQWLALFNEASANDFFKLAPSLRCPVYFFVGKNDRQTNFQITADYYHAVVADQKKLYLFDHTAHNLPTAQPARLQQIILEEILPSIK